MNEKAYFSYAGKNYNTAIPCKERNCGVIVYSYLQIKDIF